MENVRAPTPSQQDLLELRALVAQKLAERGERLADKSEILRLKRSTRLLRRATSKDHSF